MRAAIVLILVPFPAVCMAATAPRKARAISGREVVSENVELVSPHVEVTGLRFIRCKAKDTGSMVLAVLGNVLSHGTSSECIVTIEIAFTISRKDQTSARGSVVVKVDRPAPNKLVPFETIADPIYPEENREQWLKDDWKALYTLSVSVAPCAPRVIGPK